MHVIARILYIQAMPDSSVNKCYRPLGKPEGGTSELFFLLLEVIQLTLFYKGIHYVWITNSITVTHFLNSISFQFSCTMILNVLNDRCVIINRIVFVFLFLFKLNSSYRNIFDLLALVGSCVYNNYKLLWFPKKKIAKFDACLWRRTGWVWLIYQSSSTREYETHLFP